MLENLPQALGEALSDVRAGLDKTVFSQCDLRQGTAALRLSSTAFVDHAPLLLRHTADGEGLSPPLAWAGVPAGAAEVVLIVEDADSPTPQPLVHAIVTAIEGADGGVAEGQCGNTGDIDAEATVATMAMGRNSLLRTSWLPPDPPPGHGVHRYVFQVFALGPGPELPVGAGREALREAIRERGLASGCLIGTHERPSTRIDEKIDQAVLPAVPGATLLAAG